MKKFFQIVVPIVLALVVVASIGWYLFVFDREFTRDMLIQEARINDMKGNSRTSAWFYNMAYVYSDKDEGVAIELANQYKSDKNYTKAEVTLTKAINTEPSVDLYTALCRAYVEQDKLMDAVALLSGITDPQIKAEIDAIRPSAPTADQLPGFYTQYIRVALSSTNGTILYTTTGEYPSIRDTAYAEPIALGVGETVIYSIAIDGSGLVSPLSVMGYTIGGVVEPAVFTDWNLESALRGLLDVKDGDPIYTNQLWEVTELVMPDNVDTLDDLALMPYLEKLTVRGKNLSSLSPLSALTKLRSLDLSGCRFPADGISIIARLPELKELTLVDCGISTIADLESIKTLTYLDISENTVRNLEALSGMSELQELYMQHNALTGLEALAPLSNLKKLDISYNSVSSLAPLSSCVKLSWLNAATNQLYNANGLSALPQLTSLSLNYNHLSDISELSACLQLVELSINNNNIPDITGLAGLTKLEVFDFSYNLVADLPDWPEGCALRLLEGSYNQVEDISVLGNMQNLTFVSMDYNEISNVDALANCNNLVQVNVYGNAIESVEELTAHNIIVNYDPTYQEED